MTWQKHIIKKHVIELQIPGDLNSRDIQNRVSAIFTERLLPLIDKALSKNSPGRAVEKIDCLELDLGIIHISDLEDALIENITAELDNQLRHVIKKAEEAQPLKKENNASANGSDLDMITYFLQTGLLPWWAKENSRRAWEQSLHQVLSKAPLKLKKLLNVLLENDARLERLVYACDDKILYSIVQSYMPGVTTALNALEAQLPQAKLLRQIWWKSIFQTAIDESVTSESGFVEKTRALLAGHIEAGTTALGNQHCIRKLSIHFQAIEDILLQVQNEGIFSDVQRRRQIHNKLKSLVSQCKVILKQIRNEEVAAPLMVWQGSMWKVVKAAEALSDRIGHVIEQPTHGKAAPEVVTGAGELQVTTSSLLKAVAAAMAVPAVRKDKKPALPSTKLYDPFSETEKIYIQNAGLVLLWPFLNRFFKNTGLANDQAFTDESAAEKACIMLQYLTGTSPESLFEAQLPLNKVLCGIDPEQPVNTEWDIAPEEAEAAENFLLAVIQHGPLWKTLSVNGFRQAYLNREGALSTRDGNWLLQVKRETYDIIVDRLPWTIQVVKLPWMEHLIFVEW